MLDGGVWRVLYVGWRGVEGVVCWMEGCGGCCMLDGGAWRVLYVGWRSVEVLDGGVWRCWMGKCGGVVNASHLVVWGGGVGWRSVEVLVLYKMTPCTVAMVAMVRASFYTTAQWDGG